MDTSTELFQKLGISLLLGLLVGMQREHAASRVAGLRSFAMITVAGTLFALIDRQLGVHGVVLAAGFLGLFAVVSIGKYCRMQSADGSGGFTTEMAILLMYGVGAYVVLGNLIVAVAVGAGIAVLLQFKPELHGIVERLGDEDLRGIMRFVLITCIVLPVLPNRTYGPYQVLNPFEIWLIVVLIVGISLTGYIVYKFFGTRAGTLLTGILGGAISSTATTVIYARRSAQQSGRVRSDALIILIASTVVYVRVMIEISAVQPSFALFAMVPILVMMIGNIVPMGFLAFGTQDEGEQMLPHENPTRLRSAMLFGLAYAVILLALAATREYYGGQGLYLVAMISGLTNVDAVTLSTARLVGKSGQPGGVVGPDLGWRLIVTALSANLVFKAVLVGIMGDRRLFCRVALAFAIPFFVGVTLMTLMPSN